MVNIVTEGDLTYNQTDKNDKWKLVHDNVNVVMIDNTPSIISTKNTILEFDTEEDLLSYINSSKLIYTI